MWQIACAIGWVLFGWHLFVSIQRKNKIVGFEQRLRDKDNELNKFRLTVPFKNWPRY
jgi:hypothetical protein